MCGRYYVEEDEAAGDIMTLRAEWAERLPVGMQIKTGEIFPGDVVPVLSQNKRHEVRTFPMQWGFARREGSGLLINARSETAADKPLFRDGMLNRRCLLPMSHYFEWVKQGNQKIRHAIRPEGTGAFCLAGIYRHEIDKPLSTFVVLTRPAVSSILPIHDRMPVLLPRTAAAEWLSPGDAWRGMLDGWGEVVQYWGDGGRGEGACARTFVTRLLSRPPLECKPLCRCDKVKISPISIRANGQLGGDLCAGDEEFVVGEVGDFLTALQKGEAGGA